MISKSKGLAWVVTQTQRLFIAELVAESSQVTNPACSLTYQMIIMMKTMLFFPLETLSIIGCKIMRTHFSQTHQNLDIEEFFFFWHSRIMSLNVILHLSPVLVTSRSQSKSSHYFITRNHPSFSQDDFSSSLSLCISTFIAFS